jgi:cell division protein FtsX
MYFLREALRNFSRHRRVNSVAIFVIAIGMCLVNGVALAYMNFRNVAAYWGSQVHIVIYVRDGLTPARIRPSNSCGRAWESEPTFWRACRPTHCQPPSP